MENKGKLEGVLINLGGQALIVPPLNFKALKALQSKFSTLNSLKVGSVPTADQMDVSMEIIHAAIVRNYPDVTLEQVQDWVDLININEILPAIMGASGLERTKGAEVGEAQASL